MAKFLVYCLAVTGATRINNPMLVSIRFRVLYLMSRRTSAFVRVKSPYFLLIAYRAGIIP
jgi:hypothetical protein